MAVGSPEYQALLAWVEAGAPERVGPSHGGLSRVSVEPAEVRLDEPGPQQLRVVARYADGSERDVTRLASYRVNDDSAATVDPQGHAVLLRRAETDLIVRYQSQVVSTRLATVINPGLALDFARLPRRNFIDDELVQAARLAEGPPEPPGDRRRVPAPGVARPDRPAAVARADPAVPRRRGPRQAGQARSTASWPTATSSGSGRSSSATCSRSRRPASATGPTSTSRGSPTAWRRTRRGTPRSGPC